MPDDQNAAQQVVQPDELQVMTFTDIPADIRRMKGMKVADAKTVMTEVSGTVMSYVRAMAEDMYRFRNWAAESIMALGQQVQDMREDVDALESVSGSNETCIFPDETERLERLLAGVLPLVENMLPGTDRDELLALHTECTAIVKEFSVTFDAGDDDGEDEPAEPEAGPEAPKQ